MERVTRGQSKKQATASGFSLLEVMLALAILAVGILATTAGQIAAMKLSRDSKNHGIALALAEQQMQVFQSTTFADLIAQTSGPLYPEDPANPILVDPGNGTPISFDRSWQIEDDTPETGMARITVNVSWTDSTGSARTASIQSMKADS